MTELETLRAENATLKEDLERERMRLTACDVAALCNTDKTKAERIDSNSPYYSTSYLDTCNAVDREMNLRAENVRLVETLKDAENGLGWLLARARSYVHIRIDDATSAYHKVQEALAQAKKKADLE